MLVIATYGLRHRLQSIRKVAPTPWAGVMGGPQATRESYTGVTYNLKDNIVIKLEASTIETEVGDGLFAGVPLSNSVRMYGLSLDFVF